jgi:hypothetical protein
MFREADEQQYHALKRRRAGKRSVARGGLPTQAHPALCLEPSSLHQERSLHHVNRP